MSRHGYSDEGPDSREAQWAGIRWQGQLKSAIRGKRGQQALLELYTALKAMPEGKRELHPSQFGDPECGMCALGVLAQSRGVDLSDLESYVDHEWGADEVDDRAVGERLDIARQMVCEVMYENDDYPFDNGGRWRHLVAWAHRNMSDATKARLGENSCD